MKSQRIPRPVRQIKQSEVFGLALETNWVARSQQFRCTETNIPYLIYACSIVYDLSSFVFENFIC